MILHMKAIHQRWIFPQEWIDTTAEFLKSLDSNHLVTVGSEGFLGSSTPGKSRCTAVESPWQHCWHNLIKLHVFGSYLSK